MVTRPFLQFTQQFCHFIIFGGVCNITVRVRLEGSSINHALIIYQLIFLVLAGRLDGVLFGVTDDLIGLGDVGLARPSSKGLYISRPGRFVAEPDNSSDGTLHC